MSINTEAIDNNLDHLTEDEIAMLRGLRMRGWAVCMFAPWESGEASQEQIEDAMAEAGWEAINFWSDK